MTIQRIAVYCASSTQVDPLYFAEARRLGSELAGQGIEIVYGGGSVGLMGHLAEGALAAGGRVVGVIPRFMMELEWGNPRVDELVVVGDMRERKQRMLRDADGAVALPGGCGTLDELIEALTFKRLGMFPKPIVLVNSRGFYAPLVEMLERCVDQRFMDPRHREMWSVVDSAAEVCGALQTAPDWDCDALRFAAI